VLLDVINSAKNYNLCPKGLLRSPIRGGIKEKGNVEYLIWLSQKPSKFDSHAAIKEVTGEKHEHL